MVSISTGYGSSIFFDDELCHACAGWEFDAVFGEVGDAEFDFAGVSVVDDSDIVCEC